MQALPNTRLLIVWEAYHIAVRRESDDGAALRARTRDPDATRSRLLDPDSNRARATPTTSDSNCASGRDEHGQAVRSASPVEP